MYNREAGLLEIKARISAEREQMGLKSFKRTPTRPAQSKDCPCIFMLEGVDDIIKRGSRNQFGYPAQRNLEVIIELVVNKKETPNIKNLFLELRKSVFKIIDSNPAQYTAKIAENVFINESRTEGPIGYGLPDMKTMRLVLDLIYTDGGF